MSKREEHPLIVCPVPSAVGGAMLTDYSGKPYSIEGVTRIIAQTVQAVLHAENGAPHDHAALVEIRDAAERALRSGQTWSETDRRASLEEALSEIVALCETEGRNP